MIFFTASEQGKHTCEIPYLFFQTKGNSNAMELAGFKECVTEVVNKWGLNVGEIITDRHIQVRKFMRETFGPEQIDKSTPAIKHWIDVWHTAKGNMTEQTEQWVRREERICLYMLIIVC